MRIVIISALFVLSTQSYAWEIDGTMVANQTKAEAFVLGSSLSSETEVTSMEVTATVTEGGTQSASDSDNCTRVSGQLLTCSAIATDPTTTIGTQYCGAGTARAANVILLPGTESWESPCVAAATSPPPAPFALAEWQYCIGTQTFYKIDWWPAPGTVPPIIFNVKRKVGLLWGDFYFGSNTSVNYVCGVPTYLKIQGVNGAGGGPWNYFVANHNCDEGGEPD
jgi:hypothetical protein